MSLENNSDIKLFHETSANTTETRMTSGNISDNTPWNEVNVTNEQETIRHFGPLGYFLMTLTFVVVLLSWVLNGTVVLAIQNISQERMKMKFLMKNAIVGDILLSISFAVRVSFQIARIDDQEIGVTLAILCANTIYDVYAYFSTFYQIFASMALALDRFYSILKPLTYHTLKYSIPFKVLSIFSIFTITAVLTLPVIFLKLEPGSTNLTLCHKAAESGSYTEEFLPFVIMTSVVVTLCIYCGVLGLIAFHRRQIQNTLGQQHDLQRVRKNQVSLAVTFFLIHLTLVLCYLPGALYFSVLTEDILAIPDLNYYLSQTTLIIYLLNTIVNPLIYIFRIRSIRFRVKQLLFTCAKGTSDMEDEPGRLTSVATISTG